MRIYDPRIGRFLSVDPLTKKYPELTPYQFASNTPIQAIDLDGAEKMIMQNYDAQNRSVTLTVVKTVEVVQRGLESQLRGMNSTNFSNIFSSHNTTVYVQTVPQNGQPITYISSQDYTNGRGFAVNVKYDVNLSYVRDQSQTHTGPEYSTATMGVSSGFSGNGAFAHGGTTANTIEYNPGFLTIQDNTISINQNFEELTAHEVGFHNMMGLLHDADPNNRAIYPTTPTLESNVHNNIYPTDDNTKLILNKNITDRRNLDDRTTILTPSKPTLTGDNTLKTPSSLPVVNLK
jgi:hypothetical protein